MKYLNLEIVLLNEHQEYEYMFENHETAIIILEGDLEISSQSEIFKIKRKNVFDQKASSVFIPAGYKFKINSNLKSQIAFCQSKAKPVGCPVMINENKVKVKEVGKNNWKRFVHDIIDNRTKAHRLLVGETFNPPGNWSSFPPHKHDVHNPPVESKMEEIYYFKILPQEGFGFLRNYSEDGMLDKTYVLKDDMIINLEKGYHPVSAMPGYTVYYLWMLAGEERDLIMNTQDCYKWIMND